ncbi:MAG: TIGR01212 family radical SAM protein [Victivallales bacterium]|nr:TIGR01212 family radical SAM protein [Victivallales bacterium]
MQKLRFFKEYLIDKYGHALYRIPIDLPLGCPNRENNFGQGCIYCAEDGNRARHLKYKLDLAGQVKSGIDFVARRYGAKAPYIAYFQSFTNTHGTIEELRTFYNEVLSQADFKMVIIGTRPDCLSDEIVELLKEISAKYELWVELGVQSSNNKTLKIIRRGHDFAAVKSATKKLANAGISCAAHVILGLPGETIEDYRQTARDIAALPFKAVKLHNLLFLKNTPLAKMFADINFIPAIKPLNEYEYAQAAAEFLRLIPDDYFIMRLNTDAVEKELIAPKWWMKKGQFLDFFKKYYASGKDSPFQGVKTEDGSFSLYHPKYRQHFHTLAGARSEAEKKFVEAVDLRQILETQQNIKLLDIGFGLGYNAVAAVELAEKLKSGKLKITSLENDIQVLRASLDLFEEDSLHRTIIKSLLDSGEWQGDFAEIVLIIGDARNSVLVAKDKFDCIFMDAFSPDKNPELWTYDFIRELCGCLTRKGRIVTYSSAYPVRGAMLRCRLFVGQTDAFGRRRCGTIATFEKPADFEDLSQKELNLILKSSAGTAYRDPGLCHSVKDILKNKSRLISRLRQLGVPKWYKDA